MDLLEKIIIGLIGFVLTSILAYLFRMRQLYVVVPKLYKNATLAAKKGSVCEVIIYNKGAQVEEDVQVMLDPDLHCELLATSSSDITLEGAVIKIARLHKLSEASMVLLVDDGVLDHSKINVSSKQIKGKTLKKVSEVPPNAARYFLVMVMLLLPWPMLFYMPKIYSTVDRSISEYRMSTVADAGWVGLENYIHSDMAKSYSSEEFPVKRIGQSRDHKTLIVEYEVYNKTALPLVVYADQPAEDEKKTEVTRARPYFAALNVEPMSKGKFKVKAPLDDDKTKKINIDFSFKAGEEFVYKIYQSVPIDDPKKN